ncbi:MAG: ribosome silencing factor [Nitrospinae bacterium]|nr:ribosome silencing factor [Nitrospinota bacterium]MBI3815216.1 ribosome silencing factor [Nitrospinota bacterium]
MKLTLRDKTILIYNTSVDKKAIDIAALDIKEYSSIADIFFICSGTSFRQVQAIADAVEDELLKKGVKCHHIEGYKAGRWILMDYNDLILHIFHEETRKFYNLERLWGDAPAITFDGVEGKTKDEGRGTKETSITSRPSSLVTHLS